MKKEHVYDCPKCGAEVDAMDSKNQLPKKISYQCPNCNEIIYKREALRLMEKKDGKKRWSLVNCLEDKIDPFTGDNLKEIQRENGWIELVKA